jgi:hypothetical protein
VPARDEDEPAWQGRVEGVHNPPVIVGGDALSRWQLAYFGLAVTGVAVG